MTKLIFMGTPDFAVPTLQTLIAQYEVIAVITQPDRPAGRNNEITPPPVKQVALAHGIPVFQPEKLRRPEAIATLRQWEADLYVVAAFGQILPQSVLDIPRLGCINVHGSLLPRWRGAAPIQAAIRAGDPETGITIMLMDAGLDTGPMLTKRAIPIALDETGATLHDKMAQLGADLLIDTLPDYLSGAIQPQKQDDLLATYAPQIRKEDGFIDWTDTALQIERQVRAYTPWPGTYTLWRGKQLKIHRVSIIAEQAPPGLVIEREGQIIVGCAEGVIILHEVQLEGKKRVSIGDFVRGYGDFIGATLD